MEKLSHNHSHRDLNFWIDSYDDLFSDFDSRPYTERVISDDFLMELNKQLTEEKEDLIKVIRFQVPEKMRDDKTESLIMERLVKGFENQYLRFSRELKASRRNGILMTVVGVAALMLAVFITSLGEPTLWQNSLKILFEPAGWFLIWTGLDKMYMGGRPIKRKRDLFARLEKSKVEFVPS
jgi:hypothetical protein